MEAKIVKNGKGKKIRIFKYNPKKVTGNVRAIVSLTPRLRSARSLSEHDDDHFRSQAAGSQALTYRVTAVTLRPVRTLSARRSPAPFVSWRPR